MNSFMGYKRGGFPRALHRILSTFDPLAVPLSRASTAPSPLGRSRQLRPGSTMAASSSSRRPLDPRNFVRRREVVQFSDEGFTREAIAALDWKSGFPPCLRLLSLVAIYSDYITQVNGCLRLKRRAGQESQGLGEEIALPFYIMTQPISESYIVVQSRQTTRPEGRIVALRSSTECSPIRDLLCMHDQILACVDKLIAQFLKKYNMAEEIIEPVPHLTHMFSFLANFPTKTFSDALSNGLKKLTNIFKDLEKQQEDIDMQIKFLEDQYRVAVVLALESFVNSISDLDNSCHKQLLCAYDIGEQKILGGGSPDADPNVFLDDFTQHCTL